MSEPAVEKPVILLEENRSLHFEIDMMLEEIEEHMRRDPLSSPKRLIRECELRLEQHFYFEEYMMKIYDFDLGKKALHVNDHMNLLYAVNLLRGDYGLDLIAHIRSAYEIHKRLHDVSFSDELERRMGL